MGNTVGSTSTNFCNFFSSEEDAYILGLWCAEKYYWSSSVGLSNADSILIERFANYLSRFFPKKRLKLRIYFPQKSDYQIDKRILDLVKNVVEYPHKKAKTLNYHLYVNSRSLLREFISAKDRLSNLKNVKVIRAYLAGRFDGDGSIDKNLRNDCRIVYGNRSEAELDKKILKRIGIENVKIYYYRTSGTFCLYVSRYQSERFLENILPHSVKLQKLVLVPRRDLVSRWG